MAADPRSFQEAMRRPDALLWRAAMDTEWQACVDKGVWEEVERPVGRVIIGALWVLHVKRNKEGRTTRYKARLTARGDKQIAGVDYFESYAPTGRDVSSRVGVSLAASRRMVSKQIDVVTAYLNSDLAEEVFMEVPLGFRKGREGKVLRLKKCLYGLVQAARAWWHLLRRAMSAAGFRASKLDPGLYVRKTAGGEWAWAVTHVDDVPLFADSEALLDEIKEVLQSQFGLKDDGPVTFVCGVEYRSLSDGRVHASQVAYAERVLEDYGMTEANPVATPMALNTRPCMKDCPAVGSEEQKKMLSVPYRGAIGSLLFLARQTRPDLAAAVCEYARFCENPGVAHWQGVQRVLRYLRGTTDRGIILGGELKQPVLEAYVDADYADSDDRKSTTGYVVLLCGAPVAWCSKRQVGKTKLSTAEAELTALRDVAKELAYLRQLIREFGIEPGEVVVHEDNQAVIGWVKNEGVSMRLKHIDVALYYLRDVVRDGEMKVQYVGSKDQLGDVLTKPVGRAEFVDLTKRMGMAARSKISDGVLNLRGRESGGEH